VDVTRRVLAVDGGGTKTDVVLIDTLGRVLAQVQGPSSQPQTRGLPQALAVLDDLAERVRLMARLPADEPLADHASVYLAGMDLPQEIAEIQPHLRARSWAPSLVVDNDTFAVLRAGTEAK
jgi:N-acetylglucosamine kinase-like BadF-type ATPase